LHLPWLHYKLLHDNAGLQDTKSLDARLESMPRQAKVPKGKIVRKALEQAVRKPRLRIYASRLVRDLCGSLSGPSDLGTNPKYLAGLGA
jgi:hypothetical protein